jgi:hypothetical protein
MEEDLRAAEEERRRWTRTTITDTSSLLFGQEETRDRLCRSER